MTNDLIGKRGASIKKRHDRIDRFDRFFLIWSKRSIRSEQKMTWQNYQERKSAWRHSPSGMKKVIYHTNLSFSFIPIPSKIVR